MTERVTDGVGSRPELIGLDTVAHHRVLEQIAAKGGHCEACGATDFAVGEALYLGYLFLNEDADAYLVALTCRNPDCSNPRTAIVRVGAQVVRSSSISARIVNGRVELDHRGPSPLARIEAIESGSFRVTLLY